MPRDLARRGRTRTLHSWERGVHPKIEHDRGYPR